jgi:hypothetical protein
MEALKRLPIGMQSFEDIRKKDFLYVDKTNLAYKLAAGGSKYYFLSRPRRFGKSLLLSTLHAYFDGRKDLFEGLAIEQLEKDWIKYPVLHLDLNIIRRGDPTGLDSILNVTLCEWEKLYGSDKSEDTFGTRFRGVIKRAYEQTGQQVVILVDEYDKPILEELDNEELQYQRRDALKEFYGVLKTLDQYIRFVFLTGVTKFSKVSIFSGLNNIRDISMNEDYVGICGITDEEIDIVLTPYVARLATKLGITVKDAREELRSRYDGYHFCENTVGIYNPYSLLNTFEDNKLRNYWFETGTPSYLVYLLKKHHYPLEMLTTAEADAEILNSTDTQSKDPIPVIYQSGYLTIKDYNPRFRNYALGFPNAEVEEGFMKFLLPYYTSATESETTFYVRNFVQEVESGKVEEFLKRLSSLFADTPYELVKELENHYQNVIFIVSKLLGFYVKAEYHTSEGSIDLVLQAPDYIYVMEFKFNGTAEEALAQINDKQYALPFECDKRHLIKVGVNFSSKTRNIDSWKIEQSSK